MAAISYRSIVKSLIKQFHLVLIILWN